MSLEIMRPFIVILTHFACYIYMYLYVYTRLVTHIHRYSLIGFELFRLDIVSFLLNLLVTYTFIYVFIFIFELVSLMPIHTP